MTYSCSPCSSCHVHMFWISITVSLAEQVLCADKGLAQHPVPDCCGHTPLIFLVCNQGECIYPKKTGSSHTFCFSASEASLLKNMTPLIANPTPEPPGEYTLRHSELLQLKALISRSIYHVPLPTFFIICNSFRSLYTALIPKLL